MALRPVGWLRSRVRQVFRRLAGGIRPGGSIDGPALLEAARAAATQGDLVRARVLLRRGAEAPDSTGSLIAGCFAVACEIDCAGDVAPSLLSHLRSPDCSLTPEQSARVADLARDRDPDLALAAARLALCSRELHLGKRGQLEALIRDWKAEHGELPPAPGGTRSAPVAGESQPAARIAPPAIGRSLQRAEVLVERAPVEPKKPLAPAPTHPDVIALATVADSAPRSGAKIVDAIPLQIGDFALRLERSGGQIADLDYQKIDAVSVAAVEDLAQRPVILIDLVLNWTRLGEDPLQILRLRSDRFPVAKLVPDAGGSIDALRSLLDKLLYHSAAVQLPDPSGARGRPFRHYASLVVYEREVLQL